MESEWENIDLDLVPYKETGELNILQSFISPKPNLTFRKGQKKTFPGKFFIKKSYLI